MLLCYRCVRPIVRVMTAPDHWLTADGRRVWTFARVRAALTAQHAVHCNRCLAFLLPRYFRESDETPEDRGRQTGGGRHVNPKRGITLA